MNIIKSQPPPHRCVVGAIAGVMRELRYCEVQAIGAGRSAVKAIILADGYLVNDGIEIVSAGIRYA